MNKHYSAILFDLDGTLLPMDYDEFTKAYFGLLCKRFPEYDPQALVAAIWKGTKAMMMNDGTVPNEQRFWDTFAAIVGEDIRARIPEFDDFYRTSFHKAQAVTRPNPRAREIVEYARSHADRVILATNPLFPLCAVEARLSWIGLKPSDFDWVTTYENSTYCKPNPAYYTAILSNFNLDPADCLMVGSDVKEDAAAATQAGLSVHLIDEDLMTHDLDPAPYPCSSWDEWLEG
jgi:FMN phosphatase YigB (HAD superfamily)